MRPIDHSRVAVGAFAGLLATSFAFLVAGVWYWLPQESAKTVAKLTRGQPTTVAEAWQRAVEYDKSKSFSVWPSAKPGAAQTDQVQAGIIIGSGLAKMTNATTKVVTDVNGLFEVRVPAETVAAYQGSKLLLTTQDASITVQTIDSTDLNEQDLARAIETKVGIFNLALSAFEGTEQGFVGQSTQRVHAFNRAGKLVIFYQPSDAAKGGTLEAIALSFRWLR